MKRASAAQGSLEYLIIIAAVLAVAAIVVLFLTGAFGSTSSSANVAKCKEAAARCATEWATSVNPLCAYCDVDCPAELVDECKAGAALNITSFECSADVDCKDSRVCMSGACSNGLCNYTNAADGTPCAGGWVCKEGVCAPICSNNIVEGDEECDGLNLSGETCVSQGFLYGTLACFSDCSSYNTSACSNVTKELVLNGGFDSHSASSFDNWSYYTGQSQCLLNVSLDYAYLVGGRCNGSPPNQESILSQNVSLGSLTTEKKESLSFSFDSMYSGVNRGIPWTNPNPFYGSCFINETYMSEIDLAYFNSSGGLIGKSVFYNNNIMGNATLPNNCSFTNISHFLITSTVFKHRVFNIRDVAPQSVVLSSVSKIGINIESYTVGTPTAHHADNVSLTYFNY